MFDAVLSTWDYSEEMHAHMTIWKSNAMHPSKSGWESQSDGHI